MIPRHHTYGKSLPTSTALVHALVAYVMKYYLGREDDGWRGMIGCEVVDGVRASYNTYGVELNHNRRHITRNYFERDT